MGNAQRQNLDGLSGGMFYIVRKHLSARHSFAFLVISFTISSCVVISNGYIAAGRSGEGYPIIHLVSFSQNSILFGIVLAFVVFCLMGAIKCYLSMRETSIGSNGVTSFRFIKALSFGMIIAILWLPCIIVMYPGIVWADTATQIYQFFGDVKIDLYTGALADDASPKISDHHPLFTTLVFSLFVWLGQQALNSASAGLFFYVLVQGVLAALAFGSVVEYMRSKLGFTVIPSMLCVLFFGLFPVFPLAFSSVAKDTLFAPFFVFFSLMFCEAIRTDGEALRDKKFMLAFICVSLLMVLSKKLAFYILAACIVVMVVSTKKGRAGALINLASCFLALNVVLPTMVFPLFDAGAGNSKEMFSVPFQQTALYFKDHGNDVSKEEYDVIDEILDAESLASRYYPHTADFVKNPARGFDGNVVDYAKVYFAEGLRHPGTYLRAFLALEAGFVSTSHVMECQFDSVTYDYFEYGGMPDIYDRPAFLAVMSEWVQSAYATLSNTPLLNILMSQGLYVFIVPLVLMASALSREKKLVLMSLPFFVSLAFMFLSPISIGAQATRYVLPLLCIFPLLVAIAFSKCNTRRKGTRGLMTHAVNR